MADARLALFGVPRNVITPAPRPLTPVEIGRPVPLVNVIAVGVSRLGDVMAHEVVMHTLPLPLIVYSPTLPALSNSTLVVVPPFMDVVPTIIGVVVGEEPQSCKRPVVPLKQARLPDTTGAGGRMELMTSDS